MKRERWLNEKTALFLFLLIVIGAIIAHSYASSQEDDSKNETKKITIYSLPEGSWDPHIAPDGTLVFTRTPDWARNDEEACEE